MTQLHTESDPRHTRLFELIRQKNQADTTVARVKGFTLRQVSADEVAQLQLAATRSLQARH
ncbi:hypothetical protein KX928_10620 [Roseobacter sp. YSTF-M11]|uniref:Uncharacterized protein n=1 Tax=Roseobacter insulae TaxID=2859783 RepID=A0A9X1K341_9RHOB|nr:hypothetical protein [Roseobacter insulae]MBW4708237.1 hypothetical protein [Roseobacter insulae]